jgi:hypothetical protein
LLDKLPLLLIKPGVVVVCLKIWGAIEDTNQALALVSGAAVDDSRLFFKSVYVVNKIWNLVNFIITFFENPH